MCCLCKNVQHKACLYKYGIGDSEVTEVRLNSVTISSSQKDDAHCAVYDHVQGKIPDLPKQAEKGITEVKL